MRLSVLAFPIVFTLLLSAAPSTAQSELELSIQALEDPPTIPIETEVDGWYELTNERIPLSRLIGTFYQTAGRTLAGHPAIRKQYLSRFGIEPGTRAESALIGAALAAKEAEPDEAEQERRREFLQPLIEDRETYMRTNREYSVLDARRLGQVYGEMVRGLGGATSRASVKIVHYIDAKVRPGAGISSSNSFSDPDHFLWACDRSFREGMEDALQLSGKNDNSSKNR